MGPTLDVDITAVQQLSEHLCTLAHQIAEIDALSPITRAAAALDQSAVAAQSLADRSTLAGAYSAVADDLAQLSVGVGAAARRYVSTDQDVARYLRGEN